MRVTWKWDQGAANGAAPSGSSAQKARAKGSQGQGPRGGSSMVPGSRAGKRHKGRAQQRPAVPGPARARTKPPAAIQRHAALPPTCPLAHSPAWGLALILATNPSPPSGELTFMSISPLPTTLFLVGEPHTLAVVKCDD